MRVSPIRLARKVSDFRSRMPQSSYYKNSQPGDALQRARRAYLLPNALTGIAIFSFAVSVFAFTLHAVSQDEFEDVPIPDAPIQSPLPPNASTNRSGGATSAGT